MKNKIQILFLCFMAASLLAACAGPGPQPSRELSAEQQKWLELETIGNHYLSQSERASSPQKEKLILLAADHFAQAHRAPRSRQTLATIHNFQRLPKELKDLRTLVQAQILLVEKQEFEASQLLNSLADSSLTEDNEQLFYRRRAAAYQQMGNYLAATRDLIWLDSLQTSAQEQRLLHLEIWTVLQNIPLQSLASLKQQSYSTDTQAWLELAYLYKLYRDEPEQLNLGILRWRNQFPNHALQDPSLLVGELSTTQLQEYADNIALLLPLSGTLARPGVAVRQGFLTAYYDSTIEPRPRVQFYDTGDNNDAFKAAYAEAILGGAELVIGPLSREQVHLAIESAQTSIPMLTLNYSQTNLDPPEGLIQFGLAPEDEARQVANYAWAQGYRSALIIAPEGEWGNRMSASFDHHWRNHGGQIRESQQFREDASIAQSVRQLLNVDESESRHREIRQVLRRNLKFETRRREDADFIFIAAFPAQARQIQPLLRFYYAEDLPVFATSHIHSGLPDPQADRDLEGIIFCDIPWILDPQDHRKQTIKRLWPDDFRDYSRLFALGMDAFEVLPYLQRLMLDPHQGYAGLTGNLSLNSRHRIERELQWAQFQRGRAVRLEAETQEH